MQVVGDRVGCSCIAQLWKNEQLRYHTERAELVVVVVLISRCYRIIISPLNQNAISPSVAFVSLNFKYNASQEDQ